MLEDISAQAKPGCITAVLGPNATGKTTLLRTIAGLLRPSSGHVHLDGEDVHAMRIRDRARRIGIVPQRFRPDVPFTVTDIVAMGLNGATGGRHQQALAEAIETCELGDLANRAFPGLSVGQQQRVVIARTLVQIESPGVLVLDEPLAPLDLRHAGAILEILRKRAAAGDTIIMSLHDLGLASSGCDDAWLLREGRLEAAGPPGEVLTEERLQWVYGAAFERLQRRDGREWIVPADC